MRNGGLIEAQRQEHPLTQWRQHQGKLRELDVSPDAPRAILTVDKGRIISMD